MKRLQNILSKLAAQQEPEHELSPRGRRIFGFFGLIFGSVFLLVGLGVIYSALSRGFEQRATSDWLRTDGIILELKTDKHEDDRRQSPISYKYEVDGNVYRSDRIAFIDRNNIDYGEWLALANGLPEEGEIEVYYSPDDPSQSVLTTGDQPGSWDGLGFGCIFAGFAAFWMTAWWVMSNWLPDRLQKETIERNRSNNTIDPYR